ncbi:hypothetical protein ACFXHA_45495 [Nocardia sp. NPDC059240]|uniref:hypothetical protein n=1 Tax=Nocardia sp. NPDC059240 TaxID=3346786 RepID=UPI0036AFDB7C
MSATGGLDMNGLWSELGKKLAERWLSLLVLPGVLYLAVVAVGITLKHSHALDIGELREQIAAAASNPAVTSTSGQVLVLTSLLICAAAVGLGAEAIGTFIERITLAARWQQLPPPFRHAVAGWVSWRQKRWDTAHRTYHLERRRFDAAAAANLAAEPSPKPIHKAARTRVRISLERPERPTWSGDRIQAAVLRLDRDYQIDLNTVWPHLWLALPDPVRDQVNQARAAMSRSATLEAWALMYLPLSIWWWPAGPLSFVLAITASRRFHTSTDTYAQLLEATMRLHATTLAEQLDIVHAGPLDTTLGHALTYHLNASQPPPPATL